MSTLMLGLWGLVNVFTSLRDKGLRTAGRIRDSTELFEHLQSDIRSAIVLRGRRDWYFRGHPAQLELIRLAPPTLDWLGKSAPRAEPLVHPDLLSPAPNWSALGELPSARAGQLEAMTAHGLPGRRFPTDDVRDRGQVTRGGWSVVRNIRYQLIMQDHGSVDPNNPRLARPSSRADSASALPEGFARFEQQSSSMSQTWMGHEMRYHQVEAVRFAYYDGNRWKASWDGARQRGLPRAVRVEAWMQPGSPLRRPATADQAMAEANRRALSSRDEEPIADLPAVESAPTPAIMVPDRPADVTQIVALR